MSGVTLRPRPFPKARGKATKANPSHSPSNPGTKKTGRKSGKKTATLAAAPVLSR